MPQLEDKIFEIGIAEILSVSEFKDVGLFAFQASFQSSKGNWIYSTGVDEDRSLAETKAIAEAFERYACDLVGCSTNGVAAHTDPHLSQVNARNELLERDALMCAWYTQAPLYSLAAKANKAYEKVFATADYQLFYRSIPNEYGLHIVLACAIGRNRKLPYLFTAAAADSNLSSAIKKAQRELMAQSFSVLHLMGAETNYQSYFDGPRRQHCYQYFSFDAEKICAPWLANVNDQGESEPAELDPEISFTDITPVEVAESGFCITQASSPKLQKLIFEGVDVDFNLARIQEYGERFNAHSEKVFSAPHPFG